MEDMKNALPLMLLFISNTALSQINLPKLPKIPNPFKKGEVTGLKVNWSCAQEDYGQIAQLPESAEVTVSVDKDGTIKYHPNIFKIKPLSKQFFQGLNPKKLFSKDKATYRVDYSDCLDRFYSSIDKAHKEYKKDCSQGDKLCDYDNRFLVKTSKEAVESSRYFEEKDNVVTVPNILPGNESVEVATEEALELLQEFCRDNRVSDPGRLLSQKVGQAFKLGTNGFSTKFPGLVCINKYKKFLKEESEKLSEEFCHEGGNNPVCSQMKANSEKLINVLDASEDRIRLTIPKEEKNLDARFGKIADELDVDMHLRLDFNLSNENCSSSNHSFFDQKDVNLSHYDRVLYQNLSQIFETGSIDCRRKFLQNYIAAKTSLLTDETLQRFCDLHGTEFCHKIMGEKEVVEKNIEFMTKSIYGDFGERFYNEQIACEDETETTIADILSKIQDSQKALRCMELKDGEFVNVSHLLNPNAPSNYLLKKTGDKKFEAYFNIDFMEPAADKNGRKATTTASQMMERAQSCMKDVSPFMKGPNGEQVTIKIVNDKNGLHELPVNQRPKKVSIGIAPNGFRSHSRMYEETIGCPVITHEVLHLFGLCDEYKEKWKEDGLNYDCRVVPGVVSVMSNQHQMFDIAVDKEVTCACQDKTCRDVMDGQDEEKKKLFLSKTIFEVVSYEDRVDYCSMTYPGNLKFEQVEDKDKSVVVSQKGPTKLVIEGREFVEGKVGQIGRVRFSCSCEANDTACLSFLARAEENIEASHNNVRGSCPSGSRFQDSNIGNAERSQVKYDPSSGEIKLTQKAKAPSLLHPSHFERIVGGGCEDKASTYIECASYAYRNGKCEVPEYCKDASQFLGIKQ